LVPQIAARAERRAERVQPDVLVWLGVIAAAWMAAYWLEVSGVAHVLHHHTIFHSGQFLAGGLALLGVWQVMTAAMMLPGALPVVLRISRARARLVFVATYAAAWTCFAVVAFVGDMGLHALVHGWPLAARYESLIPAAVLGVAAAYQLSSGKRASLSACRKPFDGDGLLAAIDYSRHCLASGWALMLIMFAAGVADLVWMAVLALTMLAEKALPSADGFRRVVAGALALVAVGTLMGGQFL
jgi:predicted metal-binding membrane protein